MACCIACICGKRPCLTADATADCVAAACELTTVVLSDGKHYIHAKRMVSRLFGSWLLWRSLVVHKIDMPTFEKVAALCKEHLLMSANTVEQDFYIKENVSGYCCLGGTLPTHAHAPPPPDFRQLCLWRCVYAYSGERGWPSFF